jgi:hypothetical protein
MSRWFDGRPIGESKGYFSYTHSWESVALFAESMVSGPSRGITAASNVGSLSMRSCPDKYRKRKNCQREFHCSTSVKYCDDVSIGSNDRAQARRARSSSEGTPPCEANAGAAPGALGYAASSI